MEPDINDPSIPSVGQPANVVTWYPTTIMNCHCQPKQVTLVIVTGFGNASQCGHCGKLYRNKSVTINENQAMINVDIILPAPTGTVQ